MRSLLVVAAVAASALLSACSTPPKTASAPVDQSVASTPVAPTTPPATSSAVPPRNAPEYLNPNSEIARRRSVYFGFDDSTIRAQDQGVIELQGRYLASHPDVAVRIEGNTDERGGSEYNLALGQRRAEAVARALRIYGVHDSQMEAVSWGKEKPVAQGHDEAAWAQNRRADVVYPTR